MENLRNGGGIVARLAAWASSRLRKTATGRAHDVINPTWMIDEKRAEMLHDVARTGNFTMLQYLYNEIEQNDPTLMVCVERHATAVNELDWSIVESRRTPRRRFDKALFEEQKAFLEDAIAGIANLPDALAHLTLAAFRGYSHVSPVWGLDGKTVKSFDLPDSWNFCYNRALQAWMWNPDARPYYPAEDARGDLSGLTVVPPGELVTVVKKRAIDWPALKIYLRMAVGERDWGRFIETYGIPPVIVTMPEMTSEDEVDKYMVAAEKAFEGRSGVVPHGSSISWASESRGVNPFADFIEHQQKLVVLMATGGTLTSLAESGSGTLAGNAQMDVWRTITRASANVIANAMSRQLCDRMVERQRDFAGHGCVADFSLGKEPMLGAKEVLELAGLAHAAGLEMDAGEISEKTGWTIRKAEQTALPSFAPSSFGNAAVAPEAGEAVTNAATYEGGADGRAEAIARALRADFRPVADRIQAILAMPEAERAAAASRLAADLDGMVDGDGDMAEVIRAQMAEAFGAA